MPWTVLVHDDLPAELAGFDRAVRVELLARAKLLEAEGPALGRPFADTLKGSTHANMKELRFEAAGGVWRAAYAFDPARQAILLVGGDKSGVAQRRFYKSLIRRADARYAAWLAGRG